MDSIVHWFTDNLGGSISRELLIFIISLMPILELRGGLIAAAILKVSYFKALPICILGNILPIPFILLLINKIFELLKKWNWMRPKIEKLENKALGKSDKIRKYEFLGLLLFVGIPLPGTGGWTGALAASLLRIPLKKSVPAIALGILLAAAIMSTATYLIPWIIKQF